MQFMLVKPTKFKEKSEFESELKFMEQFNSWSQFQEYLQIHTQNYTRPDFVYQKAISVFFNPQLVNKEQLPTIICSSLVELQRVEANIVFESAQQKIKFFIDIWLSDVKFFNEICKTVKFKDICVCFADFNDYIVEKILQMPATIFAALFITTQNYTSASIYHLLSSFPNAKDKIISKIESILFGEDNVFLKKHFENNIGSNHRYLPQFKSCFPTKMNDFLNRCLVSEELFMAVVINLYKLREFVEEYPHRADEIKNYYIKCCCNNLDFFRTSVVKNIADPTFKFVLKELFPDNTWIIKLCLNSLANFKVTILYHFDELWQVESMFSQQMPQIINCYLEALLNWNKFEEQPVKDITQLFHRIKNISDAKKRLNENLNVEPILDKYLFSSLDNFMYLVKDNDSRKTAIKLGYGYYGDTAINIRFIACLVDNSEYYAKIKFDLFTIFEDIGLDKNPCNFGSPYFPQSKTILTLCWSLMRSQTPDDIKIIFTEIKTNQSIKHNTVQIFCDFIDSYLQKIENKESSFYHELISMRTNINGIKFPSLGYLCIDSLVKAKVIATNPNKQTVKFFWLAKEEQLEIFYNMRGMDNDIRVAKILNTNNFYVIAKTISGEIMKGEIPADVELYKHLKTIADFKIDNEQKQNLLIECQKYLMSNTFKNTATILTQIKQVFSEENIEIHGNIWPIVNRKQ